jgi:hypothetical protein
VVLWWGELALSSAGPGLLGLRDGLGSRGTSVRSAGSAAAELEPFQACCGPYGTAVELSCWLWEPVSAAVAR